ncbi:hypothetical protein PHET_05551 [Paragonimus heterotremus]|uniref:EF-hand domain-containing protein n=1 Tax=Paragonimus heterotremus TaxID=100268 RepID=A0A8J4WRH4_9TREM|nr:hypothetical protein PHET_05551 [Paragonimus heterotremus]
MYKRDAAFRNDLVDKAEAWYLKHEKRYMNTVKLIGKEMLSRVEFNLAMRHMQAPFDDVELYLLYEMLEPNEMGEVEFVKFAEVILQQYVAKDSMENTLLQMPSEESHMWLLLTFRIPSLDAFDTTLTFEALVTIHHTGNMLRRLILTKKDNLPSHSLIIFTDPARYTSTVIRCNEQLCEVGYSGGSKSFPHEEKEEIIPSKILTPSERILGKLEKLAKRDDKVLEYKSREYLSTWSAYEQFVAQVEKWYDKNSKRYMRYMSQYGKDVISEVEFKTVMRDLHVPFTDVQVHILFMWLDPKRTGQVEFSRLYEALYAALYKRFAVDDDHKTMNIEYQKKWIRMTFKSPTCDLLEMPTTFEALIHLGFTGAMLTELIRARVPALATRNFVIFTDHSRYSETLVHCNQRLYEFEYTGGPKCAPKEGTIFYEFSMGHIDCPLLLNLNPKEKQRPEESEVPGQQDATSTVAKDQTSSD